MQLVTGILKFDVKNAFDSILHQDDNRFYPEDHFMCSLTGPILLYLTPHYAKRPQKMFSKPELR